MSNNEKLNLKDLLPVIAEKLENGGSVVFKPNGTSMLPLIRQGKDSVVIEKVKEKPSPYDIIFYRRNDGQFVIHRIVGEDEKGFILRGDNQTCLEHGITKDMILGKITHIIRGKKKIPQNGLRNKIYLKVGLLLCYYKAVIREKIIREKEKLSKKRGV